LWDCCVGVYGTFRTIPTVESYGVGVFCSRPNPYSCIPVNGHNSINNNVFSRFNDVNLFLIMVSECSVSPVVGPQGGRRTTATTMVVGALTKRCE
jgi:hypothetical protein